MIVVLKQKIKQFYTQLSKLSLDIDQTYFLTNHEDILYFVASFLWSKLMGDPQDFVQMIYPN